jgi:hypothetical protein
MGYSKLVTAGVRASRKQYAPVSGGACTFLPDFVHNAQVRLRRGKKAASQWEIVIHVPAESVVCGGMGH